MGFFKGNNKQQMQHRDPRAASPRQWPPTRLSVWQLLYLVVMQGLGGLIIAGGINFAIAYGMLPPSIICWSKLLSTLHLTPNLSDLLLSAFV